MFGLLTVNQRGGGGLNPENANGHLRSLAKGSGSIVYGNMSWGDASKDRFANDNFNFPWEKPKMAATTKLPSIYKGCDDNSCAFPAVNLNKWKIVFPDPRIDVKSGLFFRRNGEIDFHD